ADGAGHRARRQGRGVVPPIAAGIARQPRRVLLQRTGRLDHGAGPDRAVLAADPGWLDATSRPARDLIHAAREGAAIARFSELEYCIPVMANRTMHHAAGASDPAQGAAVTPRLAIEPIDTSFSF